MVCNDYTAQREQHLQRLSSLTLADVGDEMGSSSSILHCSKGPAMTTSLSLGVDALAGTAKLPQNVLEGIWNKAAELLKSEGAIVSAPGMGSSAKFVKSYSGRRPHLVVAKKGGAFTCNTDCPNWKGMGICSHSVAVAELSGQLPEFVAYYKRNKRIPSLTKMAVATMPKGRGRKGGEQPQKRRRVVQTETRVENPTMEETPTSPPNLQTQPTGVTAPQSDNSNSPNFPPSQPALTNVTGPAFPVLSQFAHSPPALTQPMISNTNTINCSSNPMQFAHSPPALT